MEIIAHTLWTTAGAKIANNVAKKKNKKIKFNYFWTAFWGLFPDIFSLSIPIIVFAFDYIFTNIDISSISQIREIVNSYNISLILYPITHSIIIFAFSFGLVWILRKSIPLAMFGWLSHIILDMPSHGEGVFATPIFYPISNWGFPYGTTWASTKFFIINYALILIVWGIILFIKHKNKKFKFLLK